MNKRINNTTEPNKKIENISSAEIDSHLYKSQNMVVDFSFEGSFVSCKVGDFNNYLKDNQEFIQKFREIVRDVHNLSQKTIRYLMSESGYRHCHEATNETKALNIVKSIFGIIEKDEKSLEQTIGGERIYQIGLESEIRLFGTVSGNVFRVYFVDYYHDYEYNQRKNIRNKRYCNYCVINS